MFCMQYLCLLLRVSIHPDSFEDVQIQIYIYIYRWLCKENVYKYMCTASCGWPLISQNSSASDSDGVCLCPAAAAATCPTICILSLDVLHAVSVSAVTCVNSSRLFRGCTNTNIYIYIYIYRWLCKENVYKYMCTASCGWPLISQNSSASDSDGVCLCPAAAAESCPKVCILSLDVLHAVSVFAGVCGILWPIHLLRRFVKSIVSNDPHFCSVYIIYS